MKNNGSNSTDKDIKKLYLIYAVCLIVSGFIKGYFNYKDPSEILTENVANFNSINNYILLQESMEALKHVGYFLNIFLVNLFEGFRAFLFLLKTFRFLCALQLFFSFLPMLNPYFFPFNVLKAITKPYFTLWRALIPRLRLKTRYLDISLFISFEVLSSIINFLTGLLTTLMLLIIALQRFNAL